MRGAAMVKKIDTPTGGQSSGQLAVMTTAKVLALRQRDPWREATERARQVATWRETVVSYVRQQTDTGMTQNNAIGLLFTRAESRQLAPHFSSALQSSAKAGRATPSRSAICEWCAQHREGGIAALLPDHKGRVVEAAGWWGPALEYYNNPGKPDMSAVHRKLTEVDGFAVSYEQIRHYLTGVPAMLGRNSPARIGKNLYRLTEKAFIRRSTQNALPGDVYVADGYRADVYLAHPVTGSFPWRPELTCAIDLRSRVLVGWRADEHEGTYAVQNMWAEAFARWNHVPPMLYVDNGSGYKNQLMDDEVVGFYARAGIQQIIHSIPGNPHGKGWIERFFRIVKDDFLKLWKPEFYCGTDTSDEALSRTLSEVKAGRMVAPTLAEFTDAFNQWIDRYNHRPHPEDKSVTRMQVWSGLVAIPPHASVSELKRQAVTLTVRRACLKHGKREYTHADLHAFNGEKLILEYDLMDDGIAVIRTVEGRWICDAHLVKSIDAIAPNRMEEKRQLREKGQLKLLDKKAAEIRARSGMVIDAEAVASNGMLTIEADYDCLPEPASQQFSLDDFND